MRGAAVLPDEPVRDRRGGTWSEAPPPLALGAVSVGVGSPTILRTVDASDLAAPWAGSEALREVECPARSSGHRWSECGALASQPCRGDGVFLGGERAHVPSQGMRPRKLPGSVEPLDPADLSGVVRGHQSFSSRARRSKRSRYAPIVSIVTARPRSRSASLSSIQASVERAFATWRS